MTIKINGTNTTAQPSITGTDTDTGLVYGTDEVKIVTGGTDRVKVDSSGNVAIGTSSPNLASGGGISLYSSSNARIKFANSTTGTATSDGTQLYALGDNFHIENKEAGFIATYTSGSERMRITSDGNVTVGGNTDGSTPAWSSLKTTLRIDGAQPVLYLNETDVATGSAGGYLGLSSTNMYLGNEGGSLVFQTSTPGAYTVERGRFLSTGGLTFNGDTATANALDDYEEGYWTPQINSGISVSSYYILAGKYTKIGNLVTADFYITFNVSSTTGASIVIGGLPYNISNDSYGSPSVQYVRGLGHSSWQNIGTGLLHFYGSANTNTFGTYKDGGTTFTISSGTSLAGKYLIGSYHYHTS